MKKFYLMITGVLFIVLSVVALIRVNKLHNYTHIEEKKQDIIKQENKIRELNSEISKYEGIINYTEGDINWKQMLEMIEKYL